MARENNENQCCPASGEEKKTGPSSSCPPADEKPAEETSCCPAPQARELPGYRLQDFVAGWLSTAVGPVPRLSSRLGPSDILGRWMMRWGIGRQRYRVAPGLYALGSPGPDAPVLVTANYKLTFDLVRRRCAGLDAWLLVLETGGINVWCAAGKGTFGTAELLARVAESGLERVVTHRELILPQLGAVGVAAHEVKKTSGFSVVYGPVRIEDLGAFLAAGKTASPEMRRVTFTLRERTVLTPVELTVFGRKLLWAVLVLLLLGGIGPGLFSFEGAWHRGGAAVLAGGAALLTGAILTPILLPWLPGRAFALKGAAAGAALALLALLLAPPLGFANGLALLLALPAFASFVAMNFTGSTTFTSPSGVELEMRRAMPCQGVALLLALASWLWAAF